MMCCCIFIFSSSVTPFVKNFAHPVRPRNPLSTDDDDFCFPRHFDCHFVCQATAMIVNRWSNWKQLMADTSIDICRFKTETKQKDKEENRKKQFLDKLKIRIQGGYDCGEIVFNNEKRFELSFV